MALLQHQQHKGPVKTFTARMPEEKYDELVDFALSKRLALTTASSHLLGKALSAEKGMPYVPYGATEKTAAESSA